MRPGMGGNFVRRDFAKWAGVGAFALAALMVSGLADPSRAESLEGYWSGGGSVSFASGAKERARCRARFWRRTSTSYKLRAVCATPSVKAEQTATVRRVGANRYAGSFYNSEYNISGTIHIRVRGGSQDVKLSSDAGWAYFRLRR